MINTQIPFEGLAIGGKRFAGADGKTAVRLLSFRLNTLYSF